MRQIVFLILIFGFGKIYCQSISAKYPKGYIPKNLTDAVDYLNSLWGEQDKLNFKKQSEQEAVSSLHFGTGLSIRNNWGLWEGKNDLVKYFNSIGINHPDDMSSIILVSFHRYLNNRDIELSGQVQSYIDNWKKADNDEEIRIEKDKELYDSFKVGDLVKMGFTLTHKEGDPKIYLWSFVQSKPNCFITGIVKDKTAKPNDFRLQIQVQDICNYKTISFGQGKLSIGDIFDFPITTSSKIERM